MDITAYLDDPVLTGFFNRLESIFVAMDRQYVEVAKHYGFECSGCEDNCCRTHFYHHTFLEFLYIHAGLNKLGPYRKGELQSKAVRVCHEAAIAHAKARPVKLMCPLNSKDLCTLYAHRPMICRLHGIPHQLRRPSRNITRGPGCETFELRAAQKGCRELDRTPFYFEMAKLEKELRQALDLSGRVKMTIAEMIVAG